MGQLEGRSEAILTTIITEYLATGEPVGSRTVSKKLKPSLSAASVRYIMSDLTEQGYISRPHISAGGVPTDPGLRVYVDEILRTSPPDPDDWAILDRLIGTTDADTREVLRRSSSVLAGLSKQAGVVTTPTAVEQTVKSIEFIKVADHRILVMLVSSSGFVLNKLIYDEDCVDQETLERYSRMLNDMLKDLDLLQARERIENELATEKTRVDEMQVKILRLGHVVLSHGSEGEIFIEGRSNILDDPEFAQVETLRAILVTFEEKSKLLNLLEKALAAQGMQIFVGSEHGLENMAGCSIIACPVRTEDAVLAGVAVIGPKRMDYRRMVGLVSATGQALARILVRTVETAL